MNNKSRKIAAIVAVAATVATLAGCSALTYEEAEASQHRVVETDYALFGGRDWSYFGPSGREVPLTEDCSDGGLFSQTCRASLDGSVEFRHSTGKNGVIISESITIRGEKHDAECVLSDVIGGSYTCAPIPIN